MGSGYFLSHDLVEKDPLADGVGGAADLGFSGLAQRYLFLWSGHGLANAKGVLGHGFIFAKR